MRAVLALAAACPRAAALGVYYNVFSKSVAKYRQMYGVPAPGRRLLRSGPGDGDGD